MEITPNTTIKFLKNVPLDNTYKHTIFFNSGALQSTYFSNKTKYTLSANSYQRVQKGVIRAGILADNIYDCNYIMFQNTSFGSKWFYAFVTGVEYVNNSVSQVTFEIDVMQTWFFDYSFNKTFVEREHSFTDNVGDNIVPESVDVGEYVLYSYRVLRNLGDCRVMVGLTIADTSDPPRYGSVYDNMFSGAKLYDFSMDGVGFTALNNFIDEHTDAPEDIQFMYMFPEILLNFAPANTLVPITTNSPVIDLTADTLADTIAFTDNTGSYTPKNKKLYTYPYNFYTVENSQGDSMCLRYEFFTNKTVTLRIEGTFLQPVKLICYPTNYKNSGGGTDDINYQQSVCISDYPICSWNSDYFAKWLAQDATATAVKGLSGIATSALTGYMVGNVPGAVIGATASAVGNVSSVMAQGYRASVHSDISRGSSSSNILVAKNQLRFRGAITRVTAQMCECIDNYFSVFGYATHKYKLPNRSSRPHWNYVKTVNCCIKGSVPADDMKQINNIYDSGITFWKNGDEVGNYSLDNSPT